jgi:hypothetical protein
MSGKAERDTQRDCLFLRLGRTIEKEEALALDPETHELCSLALARTLMNE